MTQADRGDRITLSLTGDVMTGRGVDQLFTHASAPRLFEPFVRDAREYVALAERKNGPIARPIAYDYIWGDALDEWRSAAPDARIVNLETSITTSPDHDRGKEIHYRMHPANVACLRTASIDVCVLANNHVLDWGRAGLEETLDTLDRAGVRVAGAGRNRSTAAGPAIVERRGGRRVLVHACGSVDSGIPATWAAGDGRAGVNLLPDLSLDTARALGQRVTRGRRAGDIVVASVHWGSNWGYDVPTSHVAFAHALVDAGVDVVHGHSSHHARPIEIYRDRVILYGCGDFLNDYEGIEGGRAVPRRPATDVFAHAGRPDRRPVEPSPRADAHRADAPAARLAGGGRLAPGHARPRQRAIRHEGDSGPGSPPVRRRNPGNPRLDRSASGLIDTAAGWQGP